MQSRSRWLVILLLGAILLFAFVLRSYNVDWAEGQLPHPDERSTVAFYAPSIRWPTEPGTFLDPQRSTLNPLWDVNANSRRSYTYGHFPLYLMVIGGHLAVKLAPLADAVGVPDRYVDMMRIATGSPGYAWVGRLLMALADTITVFYMFLLGRRLYSKHAGLLAAALGAVTVLQIQLAHFFAVDPISTTFTVAAVYHAVRMVDTGSWKQAVATGAMAALAIASKFSAAPILAAPVVAGVILTWRQMHVTGSDERSTRQTPGWLLAGAALVVAFVVFAVSSPFVLLDFESFRQAVITEQGAMVRGVADLPFTRQYRGTIPYLYFIEQLVRWGMGWPLGVLGWLALGWALLKVVLRKASAGEWIVLSWLVPYFLITGSFLAKFNRYMVPVAPFLTVLGVGMIWTFAAWVARRRSQRAEVREQRSEDRGQVSEAATPAPQPRPARLFWALGLIVLVPTVLWGLAFVNGVYGREHTFITASKWMYENVPDGSVWVTEHWEEGMPLILPIPRGNPGEHGWQNLVLPMYEEDNAQKFEILKQSLRDGDYYVLATKRLYGALARLPERYPMSNKFYELLFSGKLGYELAGEFTAYPSLFGIDVPDQSADESFWVYDHPRVLIYKKERELSDAEWDQLLGGSWETAIPYYTGQQTDNQGVVNVAGENTEANLLLDQPVNTLPSVGRVAWNPLRYNTLGSLIVWWLALLLIQALSWPLAFAVFPNLRDRGYAFARALGLIVLAWISWILPSSRLMVNNLLPVALALLVLLVLAIVLWRRQADTMRSFARVHRRLLLGIEALFTITFLFFVGVRLFNPDLWQPWQGGEKFMEFAFLNAVTRTPYFPPYDPYFAGGIMNYYYYGYQLIAVLVKLTGISATLAFNLAIPTLFALTATGVFSLVYSLTPRPRSIADTDMRRWWRRATGAGLVGVLFVALIGNLDGGLLVLRQLAERSTSTFTSNLPLLQSTVRTFSGAVNTFVGDAGPLTSYNYWTPSRVIPFTINEFPLWSYLFADLHPHMMGIPFTVLFLALAYNLLAGYGQAWKVEGRLNGALSLLALPLVLGAIGATNTWDLPTYLGVGVLAWLVREWKGYRRIRILPTLLFVLGLAGLSYALYLPFYSNYTTVFDTGVGLTYMKTEFGTWLRIWGLFFFLALSYVVIELLRAPGDVTVLRWLTGMIRYPTARFLDLFSALVRPAWDFNFLRVVLVVIAVLSIALVWLGYTVIAVLLPLVAFTAVFLFRRTTSGEAQFRALLFFTAFLLLLGVEIVFIKDFLCGCGEGFFSRQHGEYYRMNTLFKFYSQVWVLLAIAAAAALPTLLDAIARAHRLVRIVWYAIFAVLIALSLVFLPLGIVSRVDDRFPGERPARTTLDGMAFMTVGQYFWPDPAHPVELRYDHEAIRWLQENVTGTPVLAEAPASWYPVNGQNQGYDYYRAGGLRASSLTGLPTFLGQHQGEQRYGSQVGPREQQGREFWETTDMNRLRELAQSLHVDYVYVGQLERTLFSPEQLAKFDQLVASDAAEVVFQNPGVTIYRLHLP